MIWVFGIVVVLLMGAIALVASGRGTPMVEEYDDRPDALVPAAGDLEARHLRRVRFSIAVRGYRMSEVDALLSRLAEQLKTDRAWRPETEPASDPASGPGSDPVPEDSWPSPAVRREDDTPPE